MEKQGELTSPRSKLGQLFKKIKVWLKIKKIKDPSNQKEEIKQDGNDNNENQLDQNVVNSSKAITINHRNSSLKRVHSDVSHYSSTKASNVNCQFNDSYILDSESEFSISSNSNSSNNYKFNTKYTIEGRRFTIGSVGSIPDFVFDPIPSKHNETVVVVPIAKIETNSFKSSRRRYSGHETIHFKSKSQKFRLSEPKREQKRTKTRLKRWQNLNNYILTLYPNMSLEVLLYSRFYLDRECTILTPMIYYEREFIVSRKYVDYRLLEESMMTLFNLDQFNLDHFLTLPDFNHYGQCQCIQVGYVSRVLVLSFNRGYNITCNKQDVLEMALRITPVM